MSENTPTPTPILGDLGPSIIRTVVPFIVGLIVAAFAAAKLELAPSAIDALTGVVTLLVGTLYYVAVRFAEQRWPGIGWLLGSPKKPTYVNDKTIPGEVVDSETADAPEPDFGDHEAL